MTRIARAGTGIANEVIDVTYDSKDEMLLWRDALNTVGNSRRLRTYVSSEVKESIAALRR